MGDASRLRTARVRQKTGALHCCCPMVMSDIVGLDDVGCCRAWTKTEKINAKLGWSSVQLTSVDPWKTEGSLQVGQADSFWMFLVVRPSHPNTISFLHLNWWGIIKYHCITEHDVTYVHSTMVHTYIVIIHSRNNTVTIFKPLLYVMIGTHII